MNWNIEEQYPDNTAAQAMVRVLVRDRDALDALDDGGCVRLVGAIVRQAAEDYAAALRGLPDDIAARQLRETEAFFRSEYFRRLTSLNGDGILRRIRKEMMK